MAAIIIFVFWFVSQLLWLSRILGVANANLSWVVGFDIVKPRQPFAFFGAQFPDAGSRPNPRPVLPVTRHPAHPLPFLGGSFPGCGAAPIPAAFSADYPPPGRYRHQPRHRSSDPHRRAADPVAGRQGGLAQPPAPAAADLERRASRLAGA